MAISILSNIVVCIEWQHVTLQALCNHFRGAKEHGFPMENEHFAVARLLKQL